MDAVSEAVVGSSFAHSVEDFVVIEVFEDVGAETVEGLEGYPESGGGFDEFSVHEYACDHPSFLLGVLLRFNLQVRYLGVAIAEGSRTGHGNGLDEGGCGGSRIDGEFGSGLGSVRLVGHVIFPSGVISLLGGTVRPYPPADPP